MMILNEVSFYSETLNLQSTMYVLLPKRSLMNMDSKKPRYRTLYLLHGRTDDHTAWMRWSNIEKYVDGLNLVVVMPAVHLSRYTDMVHGGAYGQFISKEVPALVRDMFSLSAKREDNYLAGLSMGGYGAFKLALTYPERYVATASLSGGLDISAVAEDQNILKDKMRRTELENVFGDLTRVRGSEHDLFRLAKKASKGKIKPRLYQCCGTEDLLYADNVRFRDFARKLPMDFTYEEDPGDHNWAYWDMMIQRVLKWMLPVK